MTEYILKAKLKAYANIGVLNTVNVFSKIKTDNSKCSIRN
jgi:hypothetical protein